MLRPLNGSGNQLREKHNIKGINTEMPLSFLPAFVDLYGIAHSLESVEGKPDREENMQGLN